MKTVYADCGGVTMLDDTLLDGVVDGVKWTIALVLIGPNDDANLIWCTNGNWSCLSDDIETEDSPSFESWLPAAVRQAVAQAVSGLPLTADDLDWCLDWADRADAVLANRLAE